MDRKNSLLMTVSTIALFATALPVVAQDPQDQTRMVAPSVAPGVVAPPSTVPGSTAYPALPPPEVTTPPVLTPGAQQRDAQPPAKPVPPGVQQQPVLPPPVAPTLPMQQASPEKQAETESFVKKAAEYVAANGKDAAFKEFNRKEGEFTKPPAYIFVVDYKGNMLADGINQPLVGKNQYDLQDAKGKYINQQMIAKAKGGGGWVIYYWTNPTSNMMECKRSYVLPMEGSYFIASGYYFPPSSEGKCE